MAPASQRPYLQTLSNLRAYTNDNTLEEKNSSFFNKSNQQYYVL